MVALSTINRGEMEVTMTYSERLRMYMQERENLLQSAADRPASEIAAELAKIAKKWEV